MHSLPVQPSKIDDYTTASNICLRISNKEYCSTRLRILINSLEPRNPRYKFKSSARRDTTQVMLGVSLRDITLVLTIQNKSANADE